MDTYKIIHNVLVSCALVSVAVISIACSFFLVKWAMPAKHVEEITQNLAQTRVPGQDPENGPADIVGTMRDLRITAQNLRNVSEQLVHQRHPDDIIPDDVIPVVRAVNNMDRILHHLQRDRNPDEEADPIPVVNIVNGANRIVDHIQRDRNPGNNERDPIALVNTVNNLSDLSQSISHPINGTCSGIVNGAVRIGRNVGSGAMRVGRGIWDFIFGVNDDIEDEEEILILECDPDWDGKEDIED